MAQRGVTIDLRQVSLQGVTLWDQFCNFLVCEMQEKTSGSLYELSQIVGRISQVSEEGNLKEEGLHIVRASRPRRREGTEQRMECISVSQRAWLEVTQRAPGDVHSYY